MSENKFEFHFHAPVGQNIANVEHMDVHVGKDGKVQVMNAEQLTASSEHATSPDKEISKVDAAIKAVFDANICESPDWVAVTRLLQERNLRQDNGLQYDADYINKICGQDVTSSNSISRSFMTYNVGGRYPNWVVKQGADTRETPNKMRRYMNIAKIVADILDK